MVLHANQCTDQTTCDCQSSASEPSHSIALAKAWFPEWYSGEVGKALSGGGRLWFLKSENPENKNFCLRMPDNFTGYIPDHKISGHKLSDLCMLQRGLQEIPPLPFSFFLSSFTSLPLFWPQESRSILQQTTAGMCYCKPLISWPTNHRLNPLKP